MFTLESPHRGDSKEYTQYTNSQYEKENPLNYPKSAAMGFFSKGPKNKFETAVVIKRSVFETEGLLYYNTQLLSCNTNKL